MKILEEQIIMTAMTMKTTTVITKIKTMTGTTIIKYQKTMEVVPNNMMVIITLITNPRVTMKIIITQKMRNMMMMMMMLMNLKIMIKIQMTSINLKMIQVQ